MAKFAIDRTAMVLGDGASLLVHRIQGEPLWAQPLRSPIEHVGIRGTSVVALEVSGQLSYFQLATGQWFTGATLPGSGASHAPLANTRALRVSAHGSVAVIGSQGEVLLADRRGVSTLPGLAPATAIAFSRNGTALGVGYENGSVVVYDLRNLVGGGSLAVGSSPIVSLAAFAGDQGEGWFASSGLNIFRVDQKGISHFTGNPDANVGALAVSDHGGALAVQVSSVAVNVLSTSTKEVACTIRYVSGRTVEGLGFGTSNVLGIGIGGPDANGVNLVDGSVFRTDPQPSLPRASRSQWAVAVNVVQSVAQEIRF